MSDTHATTLDHNGEPVHHFAHHFASADDEFEAAKQGMWLFLVTEVLMFGGLFVAYGIFRGLYPDMFRECHEYLNWKLGATNTVVLITRLYDHGDCSELDSKGQTRSRDPHAGFDHHARGLFLGH